MKNDNANNMMSMEEAVDHICTLLNLMTLADVIPNGTTVYNTDTGEMEELEPMIREANKELHWLLERACIGNKGDGNDSEKADRAKGNANFLDQYLERKKAMMGKIDEALEQFAKWANDAFDAATVEDIDAVLDSNDPLVDDGDRRMLCKVRIAKRLGGVLCIVGVE